MKKEKKRNRGRVFRKSGKLLGKLGEGFRGIFSISGRRRVFRDGGDGEADRPSGPQRARDSRHGGRPRHWEGTCGCWPGRCRRDSRYARLGDREG
jgi:hypothetical protein